jgi:hypothetical protein
MSEEDIKRARDDARCEAAVQTLVDVARRFEETCEGSYTIYDLVGYLVEDLVRDGCCAACIGDTIGAVFQDVGVDPTKHTLNEDTIH